MNFYSVSSCSSATVGSTRRSPLGSIASALLLAVSVAACGDGGDEEVYVAPEGGAPVIVPDGGGAGGLPGSTVPVGQVYELDSGTAGALFGGTNGNGTNPVNPTGGLTGGLAGFGGIGGATNPTGGLGGFTGGAAGGTSGIIGGLIGGLTGGGAAMGGMATPATPLDPSVKKPDPSKLPKVNGACDLRDGTVTVAGSSVRLWVGTKPGPVYFYFHGTGSSPDEVNQGFPGAASAVRTNGGIVAAWGGSNGKGESTGSVWAVWFTGDFEAADQILACGVEKGIVDTGRIHVAGYSAGGLQSGAMLFMRSNYLASGIIYSGGKGFGAGRLQDPSNAPAILGAHGAQGSDWLILDFSDGTQAAEKELKQAGAFAMDCDDGGGHVALSRLGLGGKAMTFLADHPYNTKPSPYAGGIPAGFPRECKIVQ